MSRAFNRKYELVISQTEFDLTDRQKQVFRPNLSLWSSPLCIDDQMFDKQAAVRSGQGNVDYVSINPAKQITITELGMMAKIGASKKNSTANTQTISIVNPSPQTQNFIQVKQKVSLRAGYASNNDLPIIFSGQIESLSVEKKGPDTVIELGVKDSGNTVGDVNAIGTFKKGVLAREVMNALIAEFAYNGVPLGRFVDSTILDIALGSFSYEGKLEDVFTTFCEAQGYKKYMHLGSLYVEPKQFVAEELLNSPVSFTRLSANQVKGYIRRSDDSKTDKSNSPSGIEANTFLNGQIRLAENLLVDYGEFQGTYKITALSHELDYRGAKWDTIVKAQKQADQENA